jgi:hypothetical protein
MNREREREREREKERERRQSVSWSIDKNDKNLDKFGCRNLVTKVEKEDFVRPKRIESKIKSKQLVFNQKSKCLDGSLKEYERCSKERGLRRFRQIGSKKVKVCRNTLGRASESNGDSD